MWQALEVEVDITGDVVPIRLIHCVSRFEMRAAVSELFEVVLELWLENPDFDVREVVGKSATIRLPTQPYLPRMDGMVSQLRQLSSLPDGRSRYEIVVVPPLWLTTRRRDHRIFQDMNVVEIARSVLAGYGPRMPALVSQCGEHPRREYSVQYGETDLDFLTRILADDGVSFSFDHHQHLASGASSEGSSTLTLFDDSRNAPIVERAVPYVPPSGALIPGRAHVFSALLSAAIETSATTLRDFDFERPAFNFESKAEVHGGLFERERDLEAYTYEVGQFASPDDRDRALQLLEEARSGRETCLLGTSFLLAPGTRLTVSGHPAEHVNGDRFVVASRSRMTSVEDGKPILHHSLETIPAEVRYRAARRPKPRIHGTQTAFVVGKKQNADEIDVDKYGRVKVRFTWDRRLTSVEGKPTRFIRVSQGWAGQGYGMVLLPRVGDELIVSYLDGDPDEPIAVGRVHNAVYASPLNLPDTDDVTVSIWKSRSSPSDGSNEDRYNMVRMQDKSGEEMLELRAQRDYHQETLHDSNEEIGRNQTVRVKGAQSTSAGSVSLSSGSTLTASAGTDMTLTAKGTFTAKGATVIVEGKVTGVNGMEALVLNGGVVRISSPQEITITAPKISINGDDVVNVHGGVINLNC
jgi:type VI secretion system secreted protein VgrG